MCGKNFEEARQIGKVRLENGEDAPVLFELHTPRPGIHATARLEGGEFVVQAGSQSRGIWAGKGTGHPSYSKLLAELVTTGVLSSQDGRCVFTENYAFKSPSAAAAVVNGRPANGTIEWKLPATNKTYKEWEAENLNQEG